MTAHMRALSRRHFLTSSAAAGLSLVAGMPVAQAAAARRLQVTTRMLEVNGKAAKVYALLGADGRPGLSFNSGDRFKVRLDNRLGEPTLIHWHGLTPPNASDGVPDMTQPALVAGGSYDYDFLLARPGTNFMHSHLGLQEQRLLAAPLIIRDPAEAHLDEQEIVVQLHDFTFSDPAEILANLQKGMAQRMTAQDMAVTQAQEMQQEQLRTAQQKTAQMQHDMSNMDMSGGGMSDDQMAQMPGGSGDMANMPGMNMPGAQMPAHSGGMDINDVQYDAFLANDRSYQDPEIVAVERGGKLRLCIINAAASSNFMIDLGILKGQLIAVDGMPVVPAEDAQFAIAVGQRLDLRIILPATGGAFPVVAQLEGDRRRSAVILATKGAAITKLDFLSEKPTGRFDQLTGHLVAARDPLKPRAVDRRLSLNLTGNMARYRWGLDIADNGLQVKQGERVEIEMVNRTAMSHPMHLHGHHFQLVAVNGKAVNGPVRDTHLVPSGSSATIAFDADNPGRWAFHCHNLYHMVSGMMTELRYV